ncbi:Uncharacterised protein [Raoultella ornithinolytica]|nr:Uncharacterised protein [Raoultella ornithinolytica]
MGVRVSHFILFNLARLRMVNRQRVAIERPFQVATALPCPGTRCAVTGHRMAGHHFFIRAVEHQIDLLRGGRPQTEIDPAVAHLSPVIQRFRRRRIGIIQYARRLYLGGGNQDPVLCGGNGYRFSLQQLIRFGIIRQFKRRIA